MTAVLVLGLAGAAMAAQGGEGDNTGCNGQGNPNSPCGGQGGAGGAGGTGIGIGVGIGISTQHQSQGQAQSQSQGQGQDQGQYQGQSYQGEQSTSVSFEGTRFDRYAPPVAAPALTSAGTGVCLGSVSIGLSGPMAGASFGITKVDKGCEQRSAAALLYQMGYKDAAVRLLMKNDDVREALGADAPIVKTSAVRAARPLPPVYQDEAKPMTWVLAPDVVQGN